MKHRKKVDVFAWLSFLGVKNYTEEGGNMFKRKGEFAPFASKVWLASPTMHGIELEYMKEAYELNRSEYNNMHKFF